MGSSSSRLYAVIAAFCLLGSIGPATADTSPPPAQGCDAIFTGDTAPTVTDAYNEAYAATPNASGSKTIQLGDVVSIKGEHLAQMFKGPCAGRTVVLFLNEHPMKGLVRNPPSDPTDMGPFHFTLKRTPEANAAWIDILGSPLGRDHHVDVSMGFQDGFALKSTNPEATRLTFDVVPTVWFVIWGIIFLLMLAVFIYLAGCTDIIRDPGPVTADSRGIFSLSRLQGAWWFFVIVAAYLFIGIVTGDFMNSINSTALILLGIGAGTVVGSAAIDAQKNTEAQQTATVAAIKNVQAQIDAAKQTIEKIDAELSNKPDAARTNELMSQKAVQAVAKARLDDQMRMLQGRSKNILFDILTDANGISFHRFQMAAFTVILSIIFMVEVYQSLAMPTFNTALMGMLGLSAGTYLGLKIPEATTPTMS